jgi:hypothetical protein
VTALTDQLTNRKIKRIISIDDENAFPVIDTLDALTDAIVGGKKHALGILAKEDPRFAAIVAKKAELGGTGADDLRALLRTDLEQLINEQKLGGQDYQKIAGIIYYGHQGATTRKLGKPFPGGRVEALSFAQWEQQYAEILGATSEDERLLLLVDERNEYEKTTELNGSRLLARLWMEHTARMGHADTIILTSACAPDAEFKESKNLIAELRNAIADPAVRAKVRRAFVISKERLDAGNLETQFEMHLNRIAAADLRSELADLTKKALHDAVSDSLQWLEDMPLSEFHGSVFVSSENEGSSELDTLLRLVNIRQRAELERRFGSAGPLQEKIAQMRRFSLKHLDPDYAKASHVELRSLRQLEFERPGALLNSIVTPLCCGDVFQLTESQGGGANAERLAVLLANPCDLTLRSNGRRKAKRGWLVPLRKDSKVNLDKIIAQSGEGASLLYKLYTGNEGDDVGYLFTNSSVDAIDLDILDLCWTNVDGRAILDPATLASSNESMLVAQKKRIALLAQRAADDRFRHIELFGTEYRASQTLVAKVSIGAQELGNRIEYPIVRVFSLAPEFAAAALSSLSQSIARPAFGHDFVRVE